MNTRVLIVEDDEFKANDLKREFTRYFEVIVVASVRDAVVRVWMDEFDVLVLDMALPTFAADGASASGTAQPQGGVEILRALKRKNANTAVIIVSQYPDLEVDDEFLALEASPDVLSERYGVRVLGAVVYDFQNREWAETFRDLVSSLHGREKDASSSN